MRPLFTPRALAELEAVNRASLPHLCFVEKPGASVPDGEGGSYTPWLPEGPGLPCRVAPVGTATERLMAGKVTPTSARYTVVFGKGVIVPLDARLRIEGLGEPLVLDPHGGNGPRSYETQRKYECSEWGAS